MTILATVGACAGLLVLVLMSLAPAIVDLDGRFPAGPREQAQSARAVRAVKTARPAPAGTAHAVKAAHGAAGTRITAHA
ncbi:hypothetical protein [Amycolatopsis saalfeldensis]|uniref:Uncharacterized protein n=1 Tax=Amycolatopsis saalfeldensis TaxID=394193 RepID=A0A1H8RHE8_9PSEU|nr:hypothetical protein [Amycolatopsis saalfeldensis]SEO65732.1 hypothetical protein SAMN04489732_101792 [Amycolatopsis saalfeldensis]